MRKTAKIAILLAGAFLPFLLFSEEKAPAQPPAPSAKPKDYGAGFEMFYKLGLPDVSKGKFVYIIWDHYYPEFDSINSRVSSFLLEENKQDKSILVVRNVQVIEAYDKKFLEDIRNKEDKEQKMLGIASSDYVIPGHYDADKKGRIGARWREVDFKKELEYVFERMSDKGENIKPYEYGSLLLTAAHAYRLGYKDEANRLADVIFKSNSAEDAVKEAIGIIADAKYEEILDKFYIDGDFSEFSKRLDSLLFTFKSGWPKRLAVNIVAEKARKMASLKSVSDKEGGQLTEEDREIADELIRFAWRDGAINTNDLHSLAVLHFGLWILPVERPGDKKESKPENVIDRIRKRGMKSIPLLLSLLDRDCFLKIDRSSVRDLTYWDDIRISDNKPEDVVLEKMYDSIRRPLSGQDIALIILKPLLSNNDTREALEDGKKALIVKYYEWYEQHKNQTPCEIAKSYLTAEGGERKSTAISFLVKDGDEENAKFIENYLTKCGLVENLELAREYCVERGDKGKEFAKKTLEVLSDEKLIEDSDTQYVNETRVVLNDLIFPRSANEIMEDIASGKRLFNENRSLLYVKLGKEKPKDMIKLSLNGAVASKDLLSRGGILILLDDVVMNYYKKLGKKYGEDISGSLPPISATAELWKTLLSDNRICSDSNVFKRPWDDYDKSSTTVSQATESVLEDFYGGEKVEINAEYFNCTDVIGKDVYESISKARVGKILEGVKSSELPRYPDPRRVSEDRRNELIEKIKAIKDDDILKLVSSMNNDEKIAVFCKDDEQIRFQNIGNGNIIIRFLKPANTINSIESDAPEWNDLSSIKGQKGKAFDKATCEKLYDICQALAIEGKAIRIEIQRKPLFGGISIRMIKVPEMNKETATVSSEKLEDMRNRGYILCKCSFISGNGFMHNLPPDARKGDAVENDDLPEERTDYWFRINEERRKDFWWRLEHFCIGYINVTLPVTITFTGYPPRKK